MRPFPRLTLLAALALVGCGGGPTPVPVSGTVTVDGKPLRGESTVVFEPVDGKTENRAGSALDADGRFVLRSAKHGDGAIPGRYKVGVSQDPDQLRIGKGDKRLEKYLFAGSSPIEVEIPPEGATDLKIALPWPAAPGKKK